MKRVALLTVLSFTAFAMGIVLISSAYADVTGKTFRVTVKNNRGFTDISCYRFDFPDPGNLKIDGLVDILIYSHGQLDEGDVHSRFKAVSKAPQVALPTFAIMLFGEEIQALEQLTGEGLTNANGEVTTFVFTGEETGPSTSPELCEVP
jgi:hypothetical protein